MPLHVGMALLAGRYVRVAHPQGQTQPLYIMAADLVDGVTAKTPFPGLAHISQQTQKTKVDLTSLGSDYIGSTAPRYFRSTSVMVRAEHVAQIVARVGKMQLTHTAYKAGLSLLKALKPHLKTLGGRVVPFDERDFNSTFAIGFDPKLPAPSPQLGLDFEKALPSPAIPQPAQQPSGLKHPEGLAAGLSTQNALYASHVALTGMTEKFAAILEEARAISAEMQHALTDEQRKRLPDSVQHLLKAA